MTITVSYLTTATVSGVIVTNSCVAGDFCVICSAVAPHMATRQWLLVALAFIEVLTATGIMFGWSAMSLALQREGAYAELCNNLTATESACDAQTIRLNVVYGAGATAIPFSMFVWGPAMDRWGARGVRICGLLIFTTGTLLFALSPWNAKTLLDAYTLAGALISTGGAGFFLSHFIIAEHFRSDGTFGLVHTLINGAFDSSTVTMVVLESAHGAGLSIQGCFLCLSGLGGLYLALTSDLVWRGMLSPPRAPSHTSEERPRELEAEIHEGKKSHFVGPMNLSHLSVKEQFRSPHFIGLAVWALITIFRTMLVLGTIGPQLQYNGGGRDARHVDQLVRSFNWLILCSAPAGPLFGRLLDRFGAAAGFLMVNMLGILAFLGIGLCESSSDADVALGFAFVVYGCFRAFNYATMTSYVQGVFGHASFGTLYGIGIGTMAVIGAVAQSPVTAWALGNIATGTWGSFAPLDVGIVLISVVLFILPAWIVWMKFRGSSLRGRSPTATAGAYNAA